MRTIEQNANGRSGYQKATRGAQMLKGAVKAGSGIASGNFVAVAQGVVEALSPKVILIIREVKDIKLIMFGETLEELWLNVSPSTVSTKIKDGQKPFHVSLEEIGSEYLLVPLGRDGVLQLKLLTLCGCKERIAKALRCEENNIQGLSECDGWKDGMPFIIGVDFNIKRVLRGLKQIEKYDNKLCYNTH